MNKWEKQVQQSLLKDEQRILHILQLMYTDVLRETEERISGYYARLSANPADTAAVYHLRHQQSLAEQLDKILDGFTQKNYTTIQGYMEDCYTNGFVGAVYDIRKQGIPVLLPIQQENVVRAITLDSQISIPMYTRLRNNIALLKTAIAAEVTRGITSGASWHDTAAHIAGQSRVRAYNAMRIARTEGHRIACAAQMDACQLAAKVGADIVKQWDSTMDDRTRQHHRDLHGQIRELEKPFEVAGLKAQYPGVFGRPEEDIHCRCCLLQRARWALSDAELKTFQETDAAQELMDIEDFSMFKGKYLELFENSSKSVDNSVESGIIKVKKKSEWINDLQPRGQLPHIDEDDLYDFVADEIKTDKESALNMVDSIMAFTDDYYVDIRSYQRGEFANAPDDIKDMSENIETYIKKAPRWNGGETFRGVSISDDELVKYKSGYRLNMGGTTSWTDFVETAVDFANRNIDHNHPNSVIYHSDTQAKGTGIRHISVFEHESEVICSKESDYEIICMQKNSDGVLHVYLKEV